MATDLFHKAEDEYFRLKGQLAAGRITQEQFEAALKDAMIQDAQGRWWMLGMESGKWYVNDGATWVEAQPPASMPSAPVAPKPSAPAPVHAPPRKSNTTFLIAGCGCALIFLIALVALFFAWSQGIVRIGISAIPTPAPTPLLLPSPTFAPQVVAPTDVRAPTIGLPTVTRVVASATAVAPIVASPTRLVPTLTPLPKGPQKKLEPIRTTDVIGLNVVDLAASAARQVYGEPHIASAAWSRDGTKILLSSDARGQRVLRVIDIAGTLLNDIQIESGKSYNVGAQEALWSPDGTRVIVRNVLIPHSTASLILFDSTGKLLTTSDRRLDKEGVPLFWSVDGKWVITVAAMPDPSPTLKYTLYAEEVATLSDSKRKTIPEWQQYQRSIGASDQVFDQRYWPWVERSAPATCSSVDFFSACP